MSTAGLVLGITALVSNYVFQNGIFYLLVVVGLPLSVVGFYRARTDGTSLIIPIASLAINAVLFSLYVLIGIIFFFAGPPQF